MDPDKTLTALITFLNSLSQGERVGFFLAQNVGVLVGALAFGWLIIAILPSHRIAPKAPPMDRLEVALVACTVVLNAVVTAVGYELYRREVVHFRIGVDLRSLLDLFILLVGMDFAMYWLHRSAHIRWLYFIHRPHHRYVKPRPLDLFVLSPLETLSFGGLWLLFLVVTSPSWISVVAYLTLNVFFGVIGHTGVELLPPAWTQKPVLRWFGTSLFHAGHHADEQHNFGFYTVLWDKLFGTFAEHQLVDPASAGRADN